MILKTLKYEGFSPNANGKIAYMVFGRNVYFSGLTRPNISTSTINAAVSVVRAICIAEGIEWPSVTFFDIQTHKGYFKKLGEFEISRLAIIKGHKRNITVFSWKQVAPKDIPAQVLRAFDLYT